MLVICEDCSKKYNIDESRIKGEKAKFSCRECGHIIEVEKPATVAPTPEKEPKRVMLEFSKIKKPFTTETIIIESGKRHQYSEQYISLTKDFYLNF